nr:uncharacterized protein LOC113811065 [Penaeus vannamei]
MPSCMMYTGQAIGFDSYDVSANNYNFPPVQQQMCSPGYVTYKSPLHASSPGYQDNCLPDQTDTGYIMDSPLYQPNMSPASSALETFLPSPMSSGSYYQNEMSGASPGYGMNQNCYEFPDTPNSLRDDSEAVQMLPTATRQASDYGQILENQSFVSEPRKDVDIGSILEAIYRVENKPQSSPIPVEDLVEITKNLRSCELAGVPNFSNFGDDLEEILEVAPRLHNVEDIIRVSFVYFYICLQSHTLTHNHSHARSLQSDTLTQACSCSCCSIHHPIPTSTTNTQTYIHHYAQRHLHRQSHTHIAAWAFL